MFIDADVLYASVEPRNATALTEFACFLSCFIFHSLC